MKRIQRLYAAPVLLSLLGSVGCDEDSTPENEPASELTETPETEVEAVLDLTHCYTDGIELIGEGHLEEGTEVWAGCFTDDYSFEFDFGVAGAGSCPGESCPLPAPAMGPVARANLAAGGFESLGYVSTQHVLGNVEVTFQDSSTAEIRGDLTAMHFRADGTIDMFFGPWRMEAEKVDEAWRATHEDVQARSFATVQATPVGMPTARDVQAVDMLGICFTQGIDLIGGGSMDEGIARWSECYTDDFSFEFDFGAAGAGSCPGENCPAPAPGMGAASRGMFASGVFASLGYEATQHSLHDAVVELDGNTGTLTGDLTAMHFRPDQSVDMFFGTYTIDVVREEGSWRVAHEAIQVISFFTVEGKPIGG